jgi:hypothetical protein
MAVNGRCGSEWGGEPPRLAQRRRRRRTLKVKIYLTHCSAKKSTAAKRHGRAVRPDKLYTSSKIQNFMRRCKQQKVRWAIFSDLYGVWFPSMRHVWYEKSPNKVSEDEFLLLLKDFAQKLREYSAIYFYYHPARFHRLYKKLLRRTKLKDRIVRFTSIKSIGGT